MNSSTPFLDRYLAGDREKVWDELMALGDRVQNPPLFNDAQALSREFVRRARHNIELLYNRLVEFGYQFAEPTAAYVAAGADAPDRIAEIEGRLGRLPIVVRTWYESIASLDFSQASPQLQGPTGPDVNGLGSHPELIMHSLDRCWNTWQAICQEDQEHYEMMERIKVENPEWYRDMPDSAKQKPSREPFLPTGGSASNCDTKGLDLPSSRIDGVLCNDGGGGDITLVKMLRNAFEWGGFPYCKYYAAGNDPLPWEARPNIEKIIPLLREGLVAV